MKKFFTLICICMTLGASLLLVGCGAPALSRPADPRIEETTLLLSWREVKSARYYTLDIYNGSESSEKNVRGTSYSLVDLPAGRYEIRIKAVGNGKDNSDSKWSQTVTFTREEEPGLTFSPIDAGTAFEVTGLGRAEGNVTVPDTYRGKPVTKIAPKAFSNKNKLTGIVLGKFITEIGDQAFYNCSYITSVTFPEGLQKIGAKAFQSCRSLSGKLTIPDNVTAIGEGTFSYCVGLSEIDLGSGVTTIGESAFSDASLLQTIAFPDSVTEIGAYAFANCKRLKSIEIGKNVTAIGDNSFAGCVGLTDVTLNDKLVEIGASAFMGCEKLTAIEIPDSVQNIGREAFLRCRQLADVQPGDGLKRIAQDAFFDTAVWNGAEVYVYAGDWLLGVKNTELTTASVRAGTVGLGDYAFGECARLTGIMLPDSVKIVGNGAFYGCKALNNVVIGAHCEEVGQQAFHGCEKLKNVILGSYNSREGTIAESNLKFIDRYAFFGCTELGREAGVYFAIPETVTHIGPYAFNKSGFWNAASDGIVYADNWLVGSVEEKMTAGALTVREGTVGIADYSFNKSVKISGVTIPDSVQNIGRSAFYLCANLVSATLPATLENIEDYTFYRCTQLKCVTLPETLKRIGRSAFYQCGLGFEGDAETEENVLVIPDGVTEIGDFAFFGCGETYIDSETWQTSSRGVDIVKFGSGLTEIGANAFNGFASLKRVELGENMLSLGEKAFYRCADLQEIVWNEKLQKIGARAFYECKALTAVTIPDSVTEIGERAFYKCERLASVDLGEGVRRINDYAFYGCVSLATVRFPDSLGYIGGQAFRNCKALTAVTVGESLTELARHAFYGCSALTVYTTFASAPQGWDARWNSSYRPVVWGCTLSADGYVTSVEKTAGGITNRNTSNTIAPPVRSGYTFAGWAVTENGAAEFAAENVTDAPDGRLYAVWTPVE